MVMVMETDGTAPLTLAEEKRKFDTPREHSSLLACSPYAAGVGDDVPIALMLQLA